MIKTIIKLVAFALVCALFFAYLAFTIGNIHPFSHNYSLAATFDDATGLLKDDNVKIAGVVVGKVTGVKVQDGKARVSFTVRKGVVVPSDSSAAVRWRNLIGQRYVYVYPGSASTRLQNKGVITHTRSVVDIGELFNRLGPIIHAIDPKQVNTFLDAIVQALDGNQEKLRQSIDDLASVAGSLAERDQAIGRLITNLDTVAGAVDERDAQIRTVLDNLLTIARTFSANTDTLNSAVTDLGAFSDNLGTLLQNNRAQLDRIIANLNVVTDEVRVKLPTLDHLLGGVDEGVKRLFNASRYGEWLNQVIPCGAIGNPPVVQSNDPCVTGASSLPQGSAGVGGASAAGASAPAAPARGMDGVLQLVGQQ